MKRLIFVTALCLALTPAAHAQSYTLGDIFARIHDGERTVDFANTRPAIHARIVALEAYVKDQDAMDMGLDVLSDIYSGARPGYATILRWNRDGFSHSLPAGFTDSLVKLNVVAHGSLQSDLQSKIGPDSLAVLYRPVDLLLQQVLEKSAAANGEKIRQFWVKYGPDSPRLNLAEAGLNYLGQLVLPTVFLGRDGGPSPYELVAAYRTTDLTVSQTAADDRKLRVVTSAQLGMRYYNFAQGCGEGSHIHQLLHPCHVSGGAFLMGPQDTPLAQLWKSGQRWGAYVAWGSYHAGYVAGQEKRLVFGLDTQVLPYIF